MKKGTGTKTRISLTLDKELVDELNEICQDKLMKLSPYVEHLIKKALKESQKAKK